MDDTFCDPLELRGDSFYGSVAVDPLEAARAGLCHHCQRHSAPSLIESAAFMAFLPGLCRHLLGEELKLPSLATWWCGQQKEQEYVIEHIDEIVVKPAWGSKTHRPYFGGKMAAAERAQLIDAIRRHPYEFVGQERAVLSTAPVWSNTKLESRPLVLRNYVTAAREAFCRHARRIDSYFRHR